MARGWTNRYSKAAGGAGAVAAAVLLLLAVAGWVLFAPQQLGGQAAYVIVNGNSMEPGMHRGDLAVVRRADDYRPGDVVTYRHPDIGHVIHRIVAEEDGRFTLRGDNNEFFDSYHPTRSEVVGRLWFYVPGAGRLLWHLRSPLWAGAILFVAFAGLLGGAARGDAGRTARRSSASHGGGQPMGTISKSWQDVLAVLVAGAIGFVVLAWVGFGRGLHAEVPAERTYTQRGAFSYEAASADGRIYDTGRATSGEPVYLPLSDSVEFAFTYEFSAPYPASLTGSYQLVAELGDPSGWKRTFPLGEPGEFQGTSFATSGKLRLSDLINQIALLEGQTDVRNDRYTVTIRPQVRVSGELGGLPFEGEFDAALPMSLDRTRLWLNSANPEQVLSPEEASVFAAPQRVTNHVRLWFIEMPVLAARVVGILGAAACLASAAVVLWKVSRLPSEQRLAEAVRIAGFPALEPSRVVDVASIDDLERVAERIGGVVLQEVRADSHVCYVRDGDVVYRYEMPRFDYGTERAA
ncbi:MAG: hypothetical protein KatS3mg062_1217 [Tepidiforma sp.]|nr:MAG: hypothetical protein KatS3mg062_1217 [Tepidiforma sp.]